MRKHIARTLLVAGTAAAAMTIAVPAAMAAITVTVTGGPNFTSTASSGTTFTLTDGSNTFHCTVGTGAGTVHDQSKGSPTGIGSITSATFGSSAHKCTGPLGSTGTDTQTSGTTTTLNVTSISGSVVTGTLTGVNHTVTINIPLIGTCTAVVKGTAGVTYNNTSSLLGFTTAGDSLSVTSTSGSCAGLVKVGDTVTFSSNSDGGETVTGSPTNPIQITTP